MELRFFTGYVTGAVLLTLLLHYDPKGYVWLVIVMAVYTVARAIAHRLFNG